MIFNLLIIYNYDRKSPITRVPHTATWKFFTSHVPSRFRRSPKVVKEAIMTDINDLVQEFWSTSSDRDVGESLFGMRGMLRLHEILEDYLKVSLYWFRFATAVDLADYYSQWVDLDETESREFMILLYGYRKIFDQSLSKSRDLGDMLRLLPGVIVQKEMTMQGMIELYGIKLECLIKSTTGLLKLNHLSCYTLDDYLSGFLQDRDRSQHYYCDPMLQHISICRHILSLLDITESLES